MAQSMISNQNPIILHPERCRISDSAEFIALAGHRIILGSNVIVEDGARIIADKTDCVITNSRIGRKVRIRNSRADGVDAYEGSQVLESDVESKVSEGYGFILERGFDFSDSNFAFSRGGVIKRIKHLCAHRPVHVPVGHCLVSRDELSQIQELNSRRIQPVEIVEDCFVINSQYSHLEAWEQFYDPGLFRIAYFVETNPEINQIQGNGIKILPMTGLHKEHIVKCGDSTKINEIQKQISGYMKVKFEFQEGAIIIEGSGSPIKTGR